jgi:ketosteroid isomerase-like protein
MNRQLSIDVQRWLRGTLVVAIMLAVAGCGLQKSGLPLTQKRSWETSFNAGNSAAVAALYAPDAQLVLTGSAPIRGRAAIRAEIDQLEQSGVKVSIDTAQSEQVGDLAYFYGAYSVSSKQAVVERGTYLEIWRRHGGQWHIEFDVNATGAPISPTAGH